MTVEYFTIKKWKLQKSKYIPMGRSTKTQISFQLCMIAIF